MAIIKRSSIKGGPAASLRMALPGFDVDTATLNQMAFDARFANMERFTQGRLVAAGAPGTNTINFGRTFSRPPLVIGLITSGLFDPRTNPSEYFNLQSPYVVWNTSNNIPQTYAYLAVGTSAMQLVIWSGIVGVEYIVFKPEE